MGKLSAHEHIIMSAFSLSFIERAQSHTHTHTGLAVIEITADDAHSGIHIACTPCYYVPSLGGFFYISDMCTWHELEPSTK